MDVDQVIELVFFVVVSKWQNGPLKNEQQRSENNGLSRNVRFLSPVHRLL